MRRPNHPSPFLVGFRPTAGPLIIRIGLFGVSYYNKEPPLGFYSKLMPKRTVLLLRALLFNSTPGSLQALPGLQRPREVEPTA